MYIYLLIINAAAFMIMCLDKQLAKHHQRRIRRRRCSAQRFWAAASEAFSEC